MKLYNAQGDRIEVDEYFDRHYGSKKKPSVVGVDMDITMFDNDLGVLVFLEKLGDPTFWDLRVEDFASLVLPGPYFRALSEGMNGEHGENLPPDLCRLALDLRDDIVDLYELIQKIVKDESAPQNQTAVIREFARKMVELDRIFVGVDKYLAKLFDGQLLMRTRFFAGKELDAVHRLTGKVMRRKGTDVYRILDLAITDETRGELNQRVSEERIAEAYGYESPHRRVDRHVRVIDDVRMLVRAMLLKTGAVAIVATANLHGIGKTAVRKSPYDFVDDQHIDGKRVSDCVVGSRLIKNGSTLGPKLENKPVLGPEKAKKVVQFAHGLGRKVGAAFGDSPTTDGPMMMESLENNGTAIIVTRDLEDAARRFEPALGITNAQDATREQIYYILIE